MLSFLELLKTKNAALFYFGAICFVLAFIFLALTTVTRVQVYNVNAWNKPFKFAFSIALFVWTMALYCSYLPNFNTKLFSVTVIVMLGFEIVYIALQAAKGQLSHYNVSTPTYAMLYAMMAIAATVVTLYTGYIGILFFTIDQPVLPNYYLWAVRLGILLFVVFSLQGFVMGLRLSHTIGGPDGSAGLPLLH